MQSSSGDDKDLIKLLETQIKALAAKSSLQLDELSLHPEIQNTFESLKLAVAMMYDTVTYPELIKAIRKNHPNTLPVPGTIGAYLFGCANGEFAVSSLPEGCSPLCMDAVPVSQTRRCCPNQVWSIENGELKKHGTDNKSTDAYLYIPDNFTHLTRKQNLVLKDKGINGIFLVRIGNSKYQLDTERKIVDEITEFDSPPQQNMGSGQSNMANLRQVEDNLTPGSTVAYVQQPTGTIGQPTETVIYRQPQSSNTWIWIIVIIIILLLLWWFYSRKKNNVTAVAY